VIGGRYEVRRRIGSGGMATVYLAHDPLLDRDVAVKVPRLGGLDGGGSPDAETLERFKAEVRAIGRLNHPNIVTVYDGGEQDGSPYLVMEPVDGESLAELIRREGPLPAERAAGIARQIAEALAYAHGLQLVHRDVKPQNILLDRSGRAKVTDFGIVKSADVTRTLTGTVLGTASFIAPEVAGGEPASAAADIYALGVVLYQMLTGHVPFEADNPITAAVRSQREDPPPPSSLAPVPDWLERVVLKALARDPRQRYQSARELADDLAAERAPAGAGAGDREPGIEETQRIPLTPQAAAVRLQGYSRAEPTRPSTRPAIAPGHSAGHRRRVGIAVVLPLVVLLGIGGGFVFASTRAPGQAAPSAAPAEVPPAKGQTNLLTNGALVPNGNGPPNGWRLQTFGGVGPRWFFQPGGPNGTQDHELGISSSSGTDTAWVGNNVGVQPGWHLTLSGFIKTQGVPVDGPGAALQLDCQASDGKTVGQITTPPVRGDTNWTQVQAQITAPAGTSTCTPLLRLGEQGKVTTGTAEFSRVSLVQDSGAPSSASGAASAPPSASVSLAPAAVAGNKPAAEKKERAEKG
jgi:hypothetical protein